MINIFFVEHAGTIEHYQNSGNLAIRYFGSCLNLGIGFWGAGTILGRKMNTQFILPYFV